MFSLELEKIFFTYFDPRRVTEVQSKTNKNPLFLVSDDENSSVHGVVTEEGLFDGTIATASDEIYIEPTSRYAPLVCHRQDGEDKDTTDAVHHHTIAYRSVDVNVPRRDGYPCASELLRENTLNELR